jgi:hypothetical protein
VSAEFDAEDREPLRDTPEGELWTSVLVDAIEDLAGSVEWVRETYPLRRAELEQDREAGLAEPTRWRERLRELERERKERETQIESCTWFFNDSDSPLEFICDVLAYPIDLIREHAQRSLTEAEASNGHDEREVAPEPEPADVLRLEFDAEEPELESEPLEPDGGRALVQIAV